MRTNLEDQRAMARRRDRERQSVMMPETRQRLDNDCRVCFLEILSLLLVIDAEAGSEHADREAERLGLTIQLAVARERRAVRGESP